MKGLQVGEATLDLLFQRHTSSVSVNLLGRTGDAEVEVML